MANCGFLCRVVDLSPLKTGLSFLLFSFFPFFFFSNSRGNRNADDRSFFVSYEPIRTGSPRSWLMRTIHIRSAYNAYKIWFVSRGKILDFLGSFFFSNRVKQEWKNYPFFGTFFLERLAGRLPRNIVTNRRESWPFPRSRQKITLLLYVLNSWPRRSAKIQHAIHRGFLHRGATTLSHVERGLTLVNEEPYLRKLRIYIPRFFPDVISFSSFIFFSTQFIVVVKNRTLLFFFFYRLWIT